MPSVKVPRPWALPGELSVKDFSADRPCRGGCGSVKGTGNARYKKEGIKLKKVTKSISRLLKSKADKLECICSWKKLLELQIRPVGTYSLLAWDCSPSYLSGGKKSCFTGLGLCTKRGQADQCLYVGRRPEAFLPAKSGNLGEKQMGKTHSLLAWSLSWPSCRLARNLTGRPWKWECHRTR